jgi:hypothetical protein
MSVNKITDRKFKREKKKKRVTRTEEYLINIRYLGDEPVYFGEVLTDLQLTSAYNWYNYMCTAADAREYIVEYMEKIGKQNIAKLVSSIPDGRIPSTAGWLCRILTRGGNITARSKEFLLDRVTRSIERNRLATLESQDDSKKPVKNVDIQGSIREKSRDIIGDIESMIDRREQFTMYEYMQKKNIPAVYSDYITQYYSKMVSELEEVISGLDPDLKEGYRHLTKAQVKRELEFYRGIVDGAQQYGENSKRIRKANKKPRTISVEKIIKNLKYQKNDQEFKLVSIDPQNILAAQELWTFNTRNRTLTVYRASDAGGLGVKSVKITGFNESTSISKKLRKPEDVLQKVLTGGKPTLRTLMDEITTKPSGFSSRVSAETILMRVVK